jgi:leucyl/phenylalanyl-tRNA--protein transferase
VCVGLPSEAGARHVFAMARLTRSFDAEDLLACYRSGVFPMAESRDDKEFFLVDPEWRCLIPLGDFHTPRRLARTIHTDVFNLDVDCDFAAVIDGCAAPGEGDRAETWISPQIRALYVELHRRGYAHSVEVRKDGELVGGLYGVALGAAFFGESMFSRLRDASKAALVHLVARLKFGGFALLDAQFLTPHLAQFGAYTVTRRKFHDMLTRALIENGDFMRLPRTLSGAQLLQSMAQTS